MTIRSPGKLIRGVLLSPAEKRELDARAARAGMKLGPYIRAVMLYGLRAEPKTK